MFVKSATFRHVQQKQVNYVAKEQKRGLRLEHYV